MGTSVQVVKSRSDYLDFCLDVTVWALLFSRSYLYLGFIVGVTIWDSFSIQKLGKLSFSSLLLTQCRLDVLGQFANISLQKIGNSQNLLLESV